MGGKGGGISARHVPARPGLERLTAHASALLPATRRARASPAAPLAARASPFGLARACPAPPGPLPPPPPRACASPAGLVLTLAPRALVLCWPCRPRRGAHARLLPVPRVRVSCRPSARVPSPAGPVRASPRVDGVCPFECVVDGVDELAPAETVRAFHATEPCYRGYRPS